MPVHNEEELAAALREAERTAVPIEPPTRTHPDLDVDGAYRVQRINLEARLASGEVLVGRKIGLTSQAMQAQLGVDRPDYGGLTDAMVIANGSTLALAETIAAKAEPEFAFRLCRPLGPDADLDAVRQAIDEVCLSVEIIDSRVAGWRIALADTIADNASCARIVCGPWRDATPELLRALPGLSITLRRDGEQVGSGPGSAVLGDPLEAVRWLASALAAHGDGLREGDIVLAGSVCAAVALTPEESSATRRRWSAHAEGFGEVVVEVIP